ASAFVWQGSPGAAENLPGRPLFDPLSALALLVGLAVSAAVAPSFGHGHKTWFIATCAGIVVNFFLNKYWTFRSVA
ncbi:MAG: hypothetical protein QOI11_3532, partial [Candidatus Eremiobacteraeota bacterium]|nr:hypothetical protein [Candidatus Eremiobacteraeota bacterium]